MKQPTQDFSPATTAQNELLGLPINQLPLPGDFIARSRKMGFANLQEIIFSPLPELLLKKEFDYEWLGVLSRFLISKNMLHLLQARPGNRSC